MKKTLAIVVALFVMPFAFANDVGTGIGLDITPESFAPLIWLCDSRVVLEDCVEAGRITDCSDPLHERFQNYIFEGEQILWKVLVMDKNKVEEIQDVVVTLGAAQGVGNDIEVECNRVQYLANGEPLPASCNARILEEQLLYFNSQVMDFYDCILTVETPNSMYGEYFVTIEVISVDGEATIDENEYWFFNPVIALSIDGSLSFTNVRPGAVAYSSTLLVGNDADVGSGVLMDMFISGTDFYDPASSGAKCPTTNRLKLSLDLRSQASMGPGLAPGPSFQTTCDIQSWITNPSQKGVDNHDHLCYYATNGAYSTATAPNADAEGYRPIVYSNQFTRDFYNDAEVIWNNPLYSFGNVLSPGAELAVTFKLGLPEPCVGDFSDGSLYFWGEAV